MSDTGNRRFIMLEECRPLNLPPGTRRTVSLGGGEPFTMLPSAQPNPPPSTAPLFESSTSPPRGLDKIAKDLAEVLAGLPKDEVVKSMKEFGKLVKEWLQQIDEVANRGPCN
jgi:hypothetical protein